MIKILLIRHGQINSNIRKFYSGRSEESLNNKGFEEVSKLTESLESERIDAIYSSPLIRCIQTAEPISNLKGLAINVEPMLNEIMMGPWQSRFEKDIKRLWPENYRIWNDTPQELQLKGRETLHQVSQRFEKFIEKLRTQYSQSITVLAISHVALIRCAICSYSKLPLDNYKKIKVNNASIWPFLYEN